METFKKLWVTVILAIIVYLLLGIYADVKNLIPAMGRFEFGLFVMLIGLTSTGYAVRFLKWSYLLRNVDVKIGWKGNAFVFMSGLLMTITPAKIGEVWRSFLIKEIYGERLSKTIPVIILDRISDILSLLFLSLFGVLYYKESLNVLLLIFLFLFALVLGLKSKKFVGILNSIMKKRFGKYSENLAEFHIRFSDLTNFKVIFASVIMGILAWLFECLTVYYTIRGFGKELNIFLSMFIFSFASLAGAISMVPGGLGVTEFTISGLLQYFGISAAEAIGCSIIIRLTTLWYGASLGLVIYFTLRKYFK